MIINSCKTEPKHLYRYFEDVKLTFSEKQLIKLQAENKDSIFLNRRQFLNFDTIYLNEKHKDFLDSWLDEFEGSDDKYRRYILLGSTFHDYLNSKKYNIEDVKSYYSNYLLRQQQLYLNREPEN